MRKLDKGTQRQALLDKQMAERQTLNEKLAGTGEAARRLSVVSRSRKHAGENRRQLRSRGRGHGAKADQEVRLIGSCPSPPGLDGGPSSSCFGMGSPGFRAGCAAGGHRGPSWQKINYDDRIQHPRLRAGPYGESLAVSPQAPRIIAHRRPRAAAPNSTCAMAIQPAPDCRSVFSDAGPFAAPVAMFIHGGFWRAFAAFGLQPGCGGTERPRRSTVALPGYDLCPQVGIGDIVSQMQQAALYLHRRFPGQPHPRAGPFGRRTSCRLYDRNGLAKARCAGRPRCPPRWGFPNSTISRPWPQTAMNADLRNSTDAEAKRAVTAVLWPAPEGKVFDAVVGGIESAEFLRQSPHPRGHVGQGPRHDAL